MKNPDWTSGLTWPEATARPRRMEQLKDSYTIRGMIVLSSIQLVKNELGAAAANAIAADVGLPDLRIAPLRHYPLRQFMELQTRVAERLSARGGSFEEIIARTGAAAIDEFFNSIAGRTMNVLAGSEPHRLLAAAPSGYSLVLHDSGRREYAKTGERSGVFTFWSDLLGPCHQLGTFDAAIRNACGLQPSITVQQSTPTDYKLLVSW